MPGAVTVQKNAMRSVTYYASATYHNKLCLLGYNNNGNWIEYYDGIQWNVIPLLIKNQNGDIDTIKIESHTGKCIAFDLQGNIWFCAKLGLYKYDGANWVKHTINDDYADRREFINIVFAPDGSAYVTAEYPKQFYLDDDKTKIIDRYTTVLMKFDGTSFTNIDSTEGGLSGLASDGGIHLLRNGKLLVHMYRPGEAQFYENNLMVYDTHNGDTKTIQTLYNPHSLRETDKFKCSVHIDDIFEDKDGNVWFGFYGGVQDDYGAVVWKQDNTWSHVKVPMRYNYSRQFIAGDSSYYPVMSLRQDNLGQVWIGGAIVMNKIQSDFTLKQFDGMNFLSNLTVFSTYSSSDSFFEIDSIVKYLSDLSCNCLKNTYSPMHPSFVSRIETTEDGSLWFMIDGLGAVLYNTNQTSAECGEHESDERFVLHSSGNISNEEAVTLTVNRPYALESIALYDIRGCKLYSESSKDLSTREYKVTPSHNSLAAGMYILSVNFKDKSFIKKIFIY